ncbi:putative sulfate exporter family transporter [Achromobacter sp. GG226]|uniref:YeiH family protein n=1 Tax=Verticiella alkaliphila TaxID=2779529 RepID=UPI001C0C7E84|nr:putative sulfate exporter family transporter [Verticiella sp. GG226]MBU4612017.1 putative sulfate exporter family transporter [Verticiella sp. GG226]
MAALTHPLPLSAKRARLDGILLVTLMALAASQIARLPGVASLGLSPLVVAVVIGMLYGNLMPGTQPAGWSEGVALAARRLLRIAIALYGLRISAQELSLVGWPGLALAATMIVSTLGLGLIVARVMRLDRETAWLTAAGSAICGAAAVLAVEATQRSAAEKSTTAVATVVVFGTLSMALYPLLFHGGFLGLDATAMGIYIGATVHEVAQVVAAASAIDPATIDTATLVKMTRVALLVPVLLVVSVAARRAGASTGAGHRPRMPVPFFVLAFAALVALNSLGWVPAIIAEGSQPVATFAMTMAMVALGMETRVARMRQAGPRVFALAGVLFVWLMVGGYGLTRAMLSF